MRLSWEWQLRIEALKDAGMYVWRGGCAGARIGWKTISTPGFLGVLTFIATAGSAFAAWFTWQAALSANNVAKDSQAFAQKVYNDQIALGHPSVTVLSGEASVSEVSRDPYFSDRITKSYAATIILRNSGLRDAPRAWVALSSESFGGNDDSLAIALVSLPKDTDVPVRFELHSAPNIRKFQKAWFVGVVYEDHVPESGTPVLGSMSAPENALLKVVCSGALVFQMSSWPKDPTQEESSIILSPGSPVGVGRIVFDQYRRPTATNTPEAIRNRVVEATWGANACARMTY